MIRINQHQASTKLYYFIMASLIAYSCRLCKGRTDIRAMGVPIISHRLFLATKMDDPKNCGGCRPRVLVGGNCAPGLAVRI